MPLTQPGNGFNDLLPIGQFKQKAIELIKSFSLQKAFFEFIITLQLLFLFILAISRSYIHWLWFVVLFVILFLYGIDKFKDYLFKKK
jgi:hypothetical protein